MPEDLAIVPNARFVAAEHPWLERTGLSGDSGGWIGGRPFLNDDPVFPGAFPEVAEAARRRVEALHAKGSLRIAGFPSNWTYPSGLLESDGRVRAMLLGVAIGDALGNTSESMTPRERHARHGEIRGYLPNPHAEGRAVGLPSDDTQLTIWSLDSMLACGRLDLDHLARAFDEHRIFGIGQAMKSWFRARAGAKSAFEARQHSAGNGALMRVVGLLAPHVWTSGEHGDPYANRGGPRSWLWEVILGSALTHDHPTSTGACVAFARLLDHLLHAKATPSAVELVELFVETMRPIEGDVELVSRVPGETFRGAAAKIVADLVLPALDKPPQEAGAQWYSGAFLLETLPTTLHLIARYRDDPQECILRAVNDTWDNDTIASLCGAAMGARHGLDAFRPEWLESLPGRTTDRDAGRVSRVYAKLRNFGGRGYHRT